MLDLFVSFASIDADGHVPKFPASASAHDQGAAAITGGGMWWPLGAHCKRPLAGGKRGDWGTVEASV